MHSAVVYLGPTLPASEAQSVFDAEYLKPIRRGDLEQLSHDVRYIGIIDGEFFQNLAVSPKEILTLLSRGVKVYGASSMGALRAAEMHSFGMIGVGRIFEAFRDGTLDADDEVAVAYEADMYRQLSDAMVNLRESLHFAQQANVINEKKKDELIAAMKGLYFPQRSWRAIEQLCPELRTFAQTHTLPDLKRDDALTMLATMHQARERDSGKAPERLQETLSTVGAL